MADEKTRIQGAEKSVTTGPPVSGLFSPNKDNLLDPVVTENSENDFERCIQCGYCRAVCRVYNTTFSEMDYAGGRNRILKSIARKEIEFDNEKIIDSVFRCMLCGNCKVVCPVGIDTVHVFRSFKKRAVEKGILPKKLKAVKSYIEEYANPFKEEIPDRYKWFKDGSCPEAQRGYDRGVELYRKIDSGELKKEDVPKDLVGYFVGCTSAYRNTELTAATCRVMERMGINFILFPEEKCCGSVLYRTGIDTTAEKMLEYNLDMVRRSGIQEIIFSCSGCFSTFSNEYVEYTNNNLGFKLSHVVQFAPRIAKEKNLKIRYKPRSKEDPLIVTYHDPCHLGRYCDVYDEPRELIKMIEGVEMIEMKHNHDMSMCCGAGGGVRSLYGDIANDIASSRLDETVACWDEVNEDRIIEALETKAEIMVSGCVFCKNNLSKAASETKPGFEVTDLSEILERCEITKRTE